MRTLGSFNHPGPMKSRSRSCSPTAQGSGANDPTIGGPPRVRTRGGPFLMEPSHNTDSRQYKVLGVKRRASNHALPAMEFLSLPLP